MGRELLLTPSGDPCRALQKQTVGTVTASQKTLTLQALLSSLNAGAAKGGCLRLWCPPAVCPPEQPLPFTHHRLSSNGAIRFDPKTQNTRKRRYLTVPKVCNFGCVAFWVCLGALLEGNKKHPKTSHIRKRRFSERSSICMRFQVCCVFGCSFWECKTDPVRFKWGFGEGLLKDKFACFEASKNPIPKRPKLLAKRPFL